MTARVRVVQRLRPLIVSLWALGYSVMVVVAAWRAPEKDFMAFTGRRVVDVVPGGRADRAGIRKGDVLVAVDGEPIRSTLDYAWKVLKRRPGETLTIDLERGARVTLTLGHAAAPLPAIIATGLALILVALGLLARYGRPDEAAAHRFWRSTVVYALVYAGGLSWTHLLVHPVLAVVFMVVLFVAPPVAMDFVLSFPAPIGRPVRGWRALGWVPSIVLFSVAGAGLVWSLVGGGDRGLDLIARCIAWLLALSLIVTVVGPLAQVGNFRRMGGAERAQLRWVLFGFALAAVPMLAAMPAALADRDHFLLIGYRPFLVVIAIIWFASSSLAVLRVRLADVESVIHRSAVYAIASSAAAAVYVAVVLVVGFVAARVFGHAQFLPHICAAVTAAALFGPIRARVTRAIDRRFFRDRLHYVQAMRELAETVGRLREPADLAREVVERTALALRASGGALELDGKLAYSTGELRGGITIPVGEHDQLVLGARLAGDLYGPQERDLLGALAGQLAIALDNARAFGIIAQQNREIRELRDRLEDENVYLRGRLEATREGALVGRSEAMRELGQKIDRVAATNVTVLLAGESGTGKGLVARTIAARASSSGPFIHLDCGAIPPGVFESELFGHERGAFTGAVRMRRGAFELAHGGTLFLDEIGELPLALQPKLLRVLQERSVVRVGGTKAVPIDVRIIAATNRDLDAMIARGEFREDLAFRLRVVDLAVPPLRARRADIAALCEHFLPRICRRNHRPLRRLSPEATARLSAYGWPGNVRELENVLERAVVLGEGREIGPDDLALPDAPPPVAEVPLDGEHRDVMESIEKRRLLAALRAAGGNQSQAARALGIARTTLINKLRRYEIN
jgi:transcriptional regulator with GAF, ATPase, and Fis domain